MFVLLVVRAAAAGPVEQAIERYLEALGGRFGDENAWLDHFRLRILVMTWILEKSNLSEMTRQMETFGNAFRDKDWELAVLNFIVEEPRDEGVKLERNASAWEPLENLTVGNETSSFQALGAAPFESLMNANVSGPVNATIRMMGAWMDQLRVAINKSSTRNQVMVTGPFINGSLVSVVLHKPFVKFGVVPAVLCYANDATGNCGDGTMFLDFRFTEAENRSVIFMVSKFDSKKEGFHNRGREIAETLAAANIPELENLTTWMIWTGDFGMALETEVYDRIPIEKRHNMTYISEMQGVLDEMKVHNESLFAGTGFYEPDPPAVFSARATSRMREQHRSLTRPDCHFGGPGFRTVTNPQWRQRMLLKKGLAGTPDNTELEVVWKRTARAVDAEYKPMMAKLFLRYRDVRRMSMSFQ